MLTASISLWEGAPGYPKQGQNAHPYMAAYLLESVKPRGAVLICPGGGYGFTSRREAEAVALQYTAAGWHAFVLYYRVAPARHPKPLMDLSRGVALIRAHAQQWQVDAGRIAVCGFSAGGHLAASLGVHWQKDELWQAAGGERGCNRPDALILCYPVITSADKAHRGSFDHLLGPDPDAALLHMLSLEHHVGPHTPPAFLWHTFNDQAVPVENSLLFAQALRRHDVPFEMHIYPDGPHGLSLATAETAEREDQVNAHVAGWMNLSIAWLRQLGW